MNRTVVSKAMWTLGLLLASAVAHAADPQPLEVDPDAEEDPSIIRGEVPRPEVVVVIRRENLDRGFVLDLKESFLGRIAESLRQSPF